MSLKYLIVPECKKVLKTTNENQNRWGPEFNPQYHKKKKKENQNRTKTTHSWGHVKGAEANGKSSQWPKIEQFE
jgi:hypothetical protein